MNDVKSFFASHTGGIVIGLLIAVAVENRTGGGNGQLTQLVDKVPLVGKFVTGHK